MMVKIIKKIVSQKEKSFMQRTLREIYFYEERLSAGGGHVRA